MLPSAKTINIITNIIGVLLAVLEPLRSYFASSPFNWTTFLTCLGGALIAYFTGKSTLANNAAGGAKQIALDAAKKVGMILLLFMVVSSMTACATLQDKWNSATPDQRAALIIQDIQGTIIATIQAGSVIVDANPSLRPQWQQKVLPAIQAVNNMLKDFIDKQGTGTFTYTDVITAVQAHMNEIRAVITSWGIKVEIHEGGVSWRLS